MQGFHSKGFFDHTSRHSSLPLQNSRPSSPLSKKSTTSCFSLFPRKRANRLPRAGWSWRKPLWAKSGFYGVGTWQEC